MIIDKSLILSKIKKYYSFKSDAAFARFLDIKPQTLATWYSRNTFDIELLYAKCEYIDGNFLLSGEGEIVKNQGEKREEPPNFREQLDDKNKIINFQDEKIEELKKEIAKLKKEKTASEYNLYVAEPSEELKKEPKK
ncbi:helix-turn-helix domain-containing protein [Flavobacterium sp. LB2P84]|uniref:helix-turn-helix domain-containing protein n=1 Tax=Flavobacterium yafengii TaxID=3041253 RepID=UPI0024A8D2D6|nr:helix-turn-helix domain-containing protein [Flavobacterium yafengii]MDI6033040.1 helix-turn-helix domain-containing protein [Flavobacterium yafengii]